MSDNIKEQREAVCPKIMEIFLKRGFKAATMDFIASHLGMSKRTLYEIFENRDQMVFSVLTYANHRSLEEMSQMFQESENMMEAMLKVFYYKLSYLKRVSLEFFEDMDTLYPHVCEHYRSEEARRIEFSKKIFQRGQEEGVFRTDINCLLLFRMLMVQFESLKRMEPHFYEEFSLSEIIITIIRGFLQSIASPRGMEVLKEKQPLLDNLKINFNHIP